MSTRLNKVLTPSGITYNSLHWWIRRKYGSASCCENLQCSGESKTFEWSLKQGRLYEKDINNFQQLCRKCHFNSDVSTSHKKEFDIGREMAQRARIGSTHSVESKLKMSISRRGKSAWNKGLKWSDETKCKMSESHKGKTPWNKGLKKYA